jgi:hypothetical protein
MRYTTRMFAKARRLAQFAGIAVAMACSRPEPKVEAKPAKIETKVDPKAESGSGSSTPAGTTACETLPFAATTPVPEASGAAWLTIDGKLALVVNSDSGHQGAYAVIDPDTGATREQGSLPLGDAGDDVEGLAGRDDKLYGLTSAGWVRVWARQGNGFALVAGPYPIAPLDLSEKVKAKPSKGEAMACGARTVNCGRNYEGLCLAPRGTGAPCVGFAASKKDGKLYCVTEQDDRLGVDRERSIEITGSERLADCAFGDDGTLWAGSNVLDASRVYRIEGWTDPGSARVTPIGSLGLGFPEAIAARGDVLYRLSDTGGDLPSLMTKFRCRR